MPMTYCVESYTVRLWSPSDQIASVACNSIALWLKGGVV
jgi:hypothetical protein